MKGRTVNITISLPDDLLTAIDRRVSEEDIDRSKYLRRLARQDVARCPSSYAGATGAEDVKEDVKEGGDDGQR